MFGLEFHHVSIDMLQTVSRYVLRGCGKQEKGSVIIFISYFVIGLPVGITLMFKTHLRLYGEIIHIVVCYIVHRTSLYINHLFHRQTMRYSSLLPILSDAYSAGIYFRCRNLTYINVRFLSLMLNPTL